MAAPGPRNASDKKLVWYFAYGSNMSREKFTGSRGIEPLASARVRTPGWILALNIPGLPYSEPTFTSIVPRPEPEPTVGPSVAPGWGTGTQEKGRQQDALAEGAIRKKAGIEHRDAVGVAYLITAAQYIKVIGSEGGGIAYDDIEIGAEPLEETDRERAGGSHIRVRTLGPAIHRNPWPKPSKRYMDIVTTGASEANLPLEYQKFLLSIGTFEPPENKRGRAGAAIFLGFWGPVMGLMEKITNATIGSNGYAPYVVILLVRFVMFMIWFTHDTFFAPLIGRGDGNGTADLIEEQLNVDMNEKTPLLPDCRVMPGDIV